MRVAVFGLGYVGSVTSACLANDGHEVIGVDLSQEKVDTINAGRAPLVEPGLEDLIAEVRGQGRLRATVSAGEAISNSEIALICVGTPGRQDGSLNTDHLEDVSVQIGNAIRRRDDKYTIVVRSTVLPGTTRNVVIPAVERASGKKAGEDFDVCFNPEFLREGTSIEDYANPARIVVGTENGKPNHLLNSLYQDIEAPRVESVYEVAEIAKYVDNAWHAVKVSFANEVGRISKSLGIDSKEVMDIMVNDTTLNISPKYLKPGSAFGGSCLPKDVSALRSRAREMEVDVPLLESIMPSNEAHIDAAVDTILDTGARAVTCLGLTFKPKTDDLRNSPAIAIAQRLLEAGIEVKIYDPNIDLATLVGANREYLVSHLPDIENLTAASIEEAVEFGETVVLTKPEAVLIEAAQAIDETQTVVDLVGMARKPVQGGYVGIGW